MNQTARILNERTWTATTEGNEAHRGLQKSYQAQSWWERLLPHWEDLTVAGREVKGFVISPTIAAVLLASFLGVLGYMYKSGTSDSRETRDAVIRMETLLNERTRNYERQQDKAAAELSDERRLNQLHRENQDRRMDHWATALKAKGINVE